MERNPIDSHIRVVRQIKNSLGPTDSEIVFEIRKETGFKWLKVSDVPETEVEKEAPSRDFKKNKAATLIKNYLIETDMSSVDIYAALKADGISKRTAEMVRKEMGIRCYRKGRKWYWSIKVKGGGR